MKKILQQLIYHHQLLTVNKGGRKKGRGKGKDDETDARSDEVNERTHVVSEKSQQTITLL
jgi:hypothetical protein